MEFLDAAEMLRQFLSLVPGGDHAGTYRSFEVFWGGPLADAGQWPA
jgi:hypothetical protein